MIHNELEQVYETFCDPYCREITKEIVANASSSNIFEHLNDNSSVEQREVCNKHLELTVIVGGTYWACEGEPFPGIFSGYSTLDQGGAEDSGDGGTLNSSSFQLEESSCPVCSKEAASQRIASPTLSGLIDAMSQYITVLDSICELISIEALGA